MNKRGQVTIFIIISIIVIVAVVLFFTLRNSSKEDIPSTPETQAIKEMVDYCLETTGTDTFELISSNGGYLKPPLEKSLDTFIGLIPYYYLDSNMNLPQLSDIENEISKNIESEISFCLDAEKELEGIEFSESGTPAVQTKISSDLVDFKLNYPLEISNGESKIILENFEYSKKSNLFGIYSAIEEILAYYSKDPGFICLNCNEDISNKYNVNIGVSTLPVSENLNESLLFYSIGDRQNYSESNLFWEFVLG